MCYAPVVSFDKNNRPRTGAFSMSKKIGLTRGMFAVVDDSDYDALVCQKWNAHRGPNGEFYAMSSRGKYMHREIMSPAQDEIVDHIDGDGLNNTRSNLRVCRKSDNAMNYSKPINNTSGYKGVSWNKGNKKFQAHISTNGRKIYIGQFNTAIEAARAYDREAIRLHGEFSNINGV